jgi:hypothetical protein
LSGAVYPPFGVAGDHTASVRICNVSDVYTDQVTFTATQLDPPSAAPPRIVGHFVSNEPAWSFDILIDLASQLSTTCI